MIDYNVSGFCSGIDYEALAKGLSFLATDEDLYSDYVNNIINSLTAVTAATASLHLIDSNYLIEAINGLSCAFQTGLEINYFDLNETYEELADLLRFLPCSNSESCTEVSNSFTEIKTSKSYEPLLQKAVSVLPTDQENKDSFFSKIKDDFNNQPLAILLMLLTLIVSLVSCANSANNIEVNINADTVIILQSVQKEIEESINELLQNPDDINSEN
jgi:hypothetical protein